ncbi:HigA family addiction module antidote protein [bacterium]|nr:HigA family addiction module antidote protein [bacterium]
MTDRRPAEVFHPGEYLLDELNARGWTQTEFAEIIRRPIKLVNEIVNKKRGITPETAQEIAAAFGTSPELWMNLDSAYNLWKSDRDLTPIRQHAKMRSQYPIRDMMLRGWLQTTENVEILQSQVLRFFEIDSLDDKPLLAFGVATRRSGSNEEELNPAQLAWLYRVKHIAKTMHLSDAYSPSKLRNAISNLMELRNAPEQTRNVPELLEKNGVRFVIVEPLPSLKIDGVCFWLDDSSPVIGLTLRFDRIDNFWFVLRHEIEHVLNNDGKSRAVIDSDIFSLQNDATLSEQERLANAAAAEFCTPQNDLLNFIAQNNPRFSRKGLLDFAKRLGLHPGLVVGQLQWKTERYELFRNMLVPIRDFIIPVSLTDGYGVEVPVII